MDTNQGMVLASVDATDDAVSLYAWRDGSFALIGSLPTGSLPAQIVTADLTGDGLNDLVVRNAGDGTLSVYFNTGSESGPTTTLPPPFLPPMTLTVGPGVSDVTLADVSGDGRTDIVVTNKLTGEVGVLRNLGPGIFAPAVLYPAGSGLYAVTSSGGPATLTTLEATAGVAAGALTAGGPADLVAIDPGSNTFSVLSGLGGGRFANPVTLPTASPAIAVLVADLEGNGIPDTIVLSTSGVTVYRGDGKGGFLPDPFTIAAGPDPTGMTVADINGDGKLDLLVEQRLRRSPGAAGQRRRHVPARSQCGPERGAGGLAQRQRHPRLHLRRPGARQGGRRLRQRTDERGGGPAPAACSPPAPWCWPT